MTAANLSTCMQVSPAHDVCQPQQNAQQRQTSHKTNIARSKKQLKCRKQQAFKPQAAGAQHPLPGAQEPPSKPYYGL